MLCHLTNRFHAFRYSTEHRNPGKSSSSSSSGGGGGGFHFDFAEPGAKIYNGVQPFSATEKFLEIVGPPNLARFVRSSLLCR